MTSSCNRVPPGSTITNPEINGEVNLDLSAAVSIANQLCEHLDTCVTGYLDAWWAQIDKNILVGNLTVDGELQLTAEEYERLATLLCPLMKSCIISSLVGANLVNVNLKNATLDEDTLAKIFNWLTVDRLDALAVRILAVIKDQIAGALDGATLNDISLNTPSINGGTMTGTNLENCTHDELRTSGNLTVGGEIVFTPAAIDSLLAALLAKLGTGAPTGCDGLPTTLADLVKCCDLETAIADLKLWVLQNVSGGGGTVALKDCTGLPIDVANTFMVTCDHLTASLHNLEVAITAYVNNEIANISTGGVPLRDKDNVLLVVDDKVARAGDLDAYAKTEVTDVLDARVTVTENRLEALADPIYDVPFKDMGNADVAAGATIVRGPELAPNAIRAMAGLLIDCEGAPLITEGDDGAGNPTFTMPQLATCADIGGGGGGAGAVLLQPPAIDGAARGLSFDITSTTDEEAEAGIFVRVALVSVMVRIPAGQTESAVYTLPEALAWKGRPTGPVTIGATVSENVMATAPSDTNRPAAFVETYEQKVKVMEPSTDERRFCVDLKIGWMVLAAP